VSWHLCSTLCHVKVNSYIIIIIIIINGELISNTVVLLFSPQAEIVNVEFYQQTLWLAEPIGVGLKLCD